MTWHTTTTLLRAAAVALVPALAPGLAAAETAPAEAAAQQFVLTATPSASLLDLAPAARAAGYASEVHQLALGGSLGFGAGDFTTVFKLNGDIQYTLSEISPRTYFDIAGHIGFGFGSNTFLFEMIPKARIRYSLDNRLSFYGDGGLGFALWHVSFEFPFFPQFNFSQTNGYALLRFSGGIQYKVTPTVILVGEPVGLNVYLGSGTGFQYSFMVGALFRV